jgi:hypothetical protein
MSTSKSFSLFILGVASILTAPLAGFAALIVNESSTWPAAPVIQTFERTNDNVTSERDVRHTRDLAQTFQVSNAFKIDKIFVDVEEAVANREYTVRLFTVPNVNAADPLVDPSNMAYMGTVLFSQIATTSAGINTADGGNNPLLALEFDLTGADEVTLPANTGTEGYALQILRTGEGAGRDGADPAGDSRAFKWHYNNRAATAASIYANGRGYAISGGGIDAGDDFLMAITAVPEPAAIALGMIAAATMMISMRRRSG